LAEHLQKTYSISERRTCRILSLNRQTKRHPAVRQKDIELRQRIHQLSEKYPRFGYRKIFDVLKSEGFSVSRERVRLIRKQEGLQVIKKQKKKRLLGRSTGKLHRAEYVHHLWSYDLVSDQTVDGRRIKCLTIIDEYTRYCLSIGRLNRRRPIACYLIPPTIIPSWPPIRLPSLPAGERTKPEGITCARSGLGSWWPGDNNSPCITAYIRAISTTVDTLKP